MGIPSMSTKGLPSKRVEFQRVELVQQLNQFVIDLTYYHILYLQIPNLHIQNVPLLSHTVDQKSYHPHRLYLLGQCLSLLQY